MSFLTGAGPTNKPPNYTGVQIQTSINTMPIPVGWGTFLSAPNLIEYTDFQERKISPGGKGALTGKGSENDYLATLMLALCEGPIDSVPAVFLDGFTVYTLGNKALKMTLFNGTYPTQAPWTYLQDNHPGDAFGYPGIAYTAVESYDLGSSAAPPQHNFVCVRTTGFQATWCNPNSIPVHAPQVIADAFGSTGIPTADMALVIQDMLSSEQYGVPGFASLYDTNTLLSTSAATTTGDASLQTYARALGIGMCPFLKDQETASSILTRWMQLLNCAAFFSGNVLKFVPYGDESITANGVTFLPNLAPVIAIADGDILQNGSDDPDPTAITSIIDANNVVRLEVTADDGTFAFVPIEAWDQNAIETPSMKRIAPTVTAHEIVGTQVGSLVAQLILQKGLYNRNTKTIKLPLTFCYLEPMDIITLTDAYVGYFSQSFRILSIEEDDAGDLTVEAEELTIGVGTAVAYIKQGNTGSGLPDAGAAAGNVNTPIIFEPTNALLSANGISNPQIWTLTCGANGAYDPTWGGDVAYVSVDNDNYILAGQTNAPARMGVLTANLATYTGANPDNTNTIYVDLSKSDGSLTSGAASDAQAGRTLCYVDGEFISYTTATLVTATASGESQTVPSDAPYQVAVTNYNTFISNTSVVSGGTTFTLVSSNPGPNQYTCNAGLYGFNQANAGDPIAITYSYGSSSHYALTGLYRGMYGTTAGAHSSGSQFGRLDDLVLQYDLPTSYVGQKLYIKFVSFNNLGLGEQDISTLTPYTYTPTGAGQATNETVSGTYVAISADATAGKITINTGLSSISSTSVNITRGTLTETGYGVMTNTNDIIITNGGSYSITAGDIIQWIAVGTGGPIFVYDTNGNHAVDTNGNWVVAVPQ